MASIPSNHPVRAILRNLVERAIEAGQDEGPGDATVADIKRAISQELRATQIHESVEKEMRDERISAGK